MGPAVSRPKGSHAAFLAGFIGSCNTSGPAGHFDSGMNTQQPPIRTDKPAYTIHRGERHGPIYLPTCNGVNPPHIEKAESQGWVIAFGSQLPKAATISNEFELRK
jgi:hypothetical protein